MNDEMITCSLCGKSFDAAAQASCSTCPLGKNCTLVCCPSCGFKMVDVHRSRLANLASRLATRLSAGFGPAISTRHSSR